MWTSELVERAMRGDHDAFAILASRLVARLDAAARLEVELAPFDAPAITDTASLIADRELLDAALKRLRPEWRAVMVLHYYLGMPLPDVAATLGIPIGIAKSRHHRSLAELRISIAADLEPPRSPRPGEQYA